MECYIVVMKCRGKSVFKKNHLATTWVVRRIETNCFVRFIHWIYIGTFIHETKSSLGKVSPELRRGFTLVRLRSKGRKWTPGIGPFSFSFFKYVFGRVLLTFS